MPKVGKYKSRYNCRLCKSIYMTEVLDMNKVPLAGNFLNKENIGREKVYPLTVSVCQDCSFVQVNEVVNKKDLFADYRYISTIPLGKHFEDYAKEIAFKFLKKGNFIVDIGSNDGVLLKPLKKLGMKVLGVDPAKNIAKVANDQGLTTIVDYFTRKVASKIVKKYEQANAVFANNVIAHIDNVDEVIKGVNELLLPDGIFVIEIYYLSDLIAKGQYDIVYHEHHSYYSLTSLMPYLAKFGFNVFDAQRVSSHSGSIRVYIQKNNGIYGNTKRLEGLLSMEKDMNLGALKTYVKFGEDAIRKSDQLWLLLDNLKKQGKRIVGYGASGRGNMLLKFCQIDNKILDYIVDESPERYGRYTPVTHIPIVPPVVFRNDYPDYALLLAWGYKDMIMKKEKEFVKEGGKFIVPLPEIKVV